MKKFTVTMAGEDCLVGCSDDLPDPQGHNIVLPTGTRIAFGRDKESGKKLFYVHSEDWAKVLEASLDS